MSKTKKTKTIILLVLGCAFAIGAVLIAIFYAPHEVPHEGQAKLFDDFN